MLSRCLALTCFIFFGNGWLQFFDGDVLLNKQDLDA
jgi:hypothetical protein